jgi:mRNA interferase MazF
MSIGASIKRGSVWRIDFDPVKRREQAGFRYGVVVSPDTMNSVLDIVIVAPLTTKLKPWPTRVDCNFNDTNGQVQCEQIRVVSKKRLKALSGSLGVEVSAKMRLIFKQMLVEE